MNAPRRISRRFELPFIQHEIAIVNQHLILAVRSELKGSESLNVSIGEALIAHSAMTDVVLGKGWLNAQHAQADRQKNAEKKVDAVLEKCMVTSTPYHLSPKKSQ